jgi:hypothetical protein
MYGILRFGVVSTPEIAQFKLGDLAFRVHTLDCTYSSTLVKVLWDTGKAILTPIAVCPNFSLVPTMSVSAPRTLIQ